MQLDAFILADAVATPPDGKFYVQGGGLTRMQAPILPAQIRLDVLVQLGGDEDEMKAEHTIRFTLIGPTGNPNVDPVEIQTRFDPNAAQPLPGEERFAVLAVTINGMAIRSGVYKVALQVDDEITAERTFVFSVPDGVEPATAGLVPAAAILGQSPAPQERAAKQKRPPPPPKKGKANRR